MALQRRNQKWQFLLSCPICSVPTFFYKLLKRAPFVFLTFTYLKISFWTAGCEAESVISFNQMPSSVLANYSDGEHILYKFLHVLTPTNTCKVTAPTQSFTVCSKQHFQLAVCFHDFILWSAIHLTFCMNNNSKKTFQTNQNSKIFLSLLLGFVVVVIIEKVSWKLSSLKSGFCSLRQQISE